MRMRTRLHGTAHTSLDQRRLARARRRPCRGGQSLVEFTLIFPFFMLVILALAQWSHMFFVHQTLQHAVREAGRNAAVGITNIGAASYGSVEQAAYTILCASSLGLLPSDNAHVHFNNDRDTNAWLGGANATFVIRVEYRYGYHTPLIPFFNAFFGGPNNFNNNSNIVVSSTFVAEKYNDDFL